MVLHEYAATRTIITGRDDAEYSFEVVGAGKQQVNGRYKQGRIVDGVPSFVNENGKISLQRRSDQCRWYFTTDGDPNKVKRQQDLAQCHPSGQTAAVDTNDGTYTTDHDHTNEVPEEDEHASSADPRPCHDRPAVCLPGPTAAPEKDQDLAAPRQARGEGTRCHSPLPS